MDILPEAARDRSLPAVIVFYGIECLADHTEMDDNLSFAIWVPALYLIYPVAIAILRRKAIARLDTLRHRQIWQVVKHVGNVVMELVSYGDNPIEQRARAGMHEVQLKQGKYSLPAADTLFARYREILTIEAIVIIELNSR